MDFKIPSASSLKKTLADFASKSGSSTELVRGSSLFSHKEGGEARLGSSLLKLMIFTTGFLFALSFCLTAETIIMSRALAFKMIFAQSVAGRTPSFTNANVDRSYGGFTELNPFDAALPPETAEEASSAYPVTSLVLWGRYRTLAPG